MNADEAKQLALVNAHAHDVLDKADKAYACNNSFENYCAYMDAQLAYKRSRENLQDAIIRHPKAFYFPQTESGY